MLLHLKPTKTASNADARKWRYKILQCASWHFIYILCGPNLAPKSSGGLAQSVKAPESNRKVASSMPWAKRAVMSLGKTLNANIPNSGSAAQWIRAQTGNRKIVDWRFPNWAMHRCVLGKDNLRSYSHNGTK